MSEIEIARRAKDRYFGLDPYSPLTDEQRHHFRGLNYFAENPALRLEVSVETFAQQDEIEMETTTGGQQAYTRYGRFKFQVDGQSAELTLYYGEHGFFLPFVDALAGQETYPAGRYLEPEPLPGGAAKFLVDFNTAYNPYCAYSDQWSCPVTPAENRLAVPIRAGEKIYHTS